MKKGQLQIQETMFVIFIFIIIFMVGLVFFYRSSVASFERDKLEYEEDKFKLLIDVIPNMPELKYSELEIDSEWCIDSLKAKAFASISDRYDFGFKKISIIGGENIVLYEKFRSSESVRKYSSPVCLYSSNKFSMAKLEVEWYV